MSRSLTPPSPTARWVAPTGDAAASEKQYFAQLWQRGVVCVRLESLTGFGEREAVTAIATRLYGPRQEG